MADGFVSTTRSLIVPMPLLQGSTWVTGVVVVVTPTLAATSTALNALTATRTGIAVTVTLTAAVTTVTIGTVITMAGTAGTGATAAAHLLGRATRPSTEGGGATRGVLLEAAAPPALGTTTLRLPALCPLMATGILAGEATVR